MVEDANACNSLEAEIQGRNQGSGIGTIALGPMELKRSIRDQWTSEVFVYFKIFYKF